MMRLSELAAITGGELKGNSDAQVSGVATLEEAGQKDIAFVATRKNLDAATRSGAGSLILPEGLHVEGKNLIVSKNPKLAFARALKTLMPASSPEPGISGDACIAGTASVGAESSIAGFVSIEDGAVVGERAILYPGVYIGRDARVGNDCVLYPNVVVMHNCVLGNNVVIHAGTVIGADGFGYVTDTGVHHKIPQVGNVVVEDDVEIGANSSIDRSTLGSTVIGRGTKLDNLVQIAHNVTVGPGCLMAAQTGVAGSSRIGRYVVLGGQVAVTDHVNVGDGVMAGGQTGIARNTEPGSIVLGTPAIPHKEFVRAAILFQRLPEMERRLRAVEAVLSGEEKK